MRISKRDLFALRWVIHSGDMNFGLLEAVDIDDLSCLISRIRDPRAGTNVRWQALYERPSTMEVDADEMEEGL